MQLHAAPASSTAQRRKIRNCANWSWGLVRNLGDFCLWLCKERLSFWSGGVLEHAGGRGGGGGRGWGGLSAGTGSNWNDALFPLTAAGAAVIKCLIVASWEFVLNISSGVMIIWWWVGGGCNHLGWLFDEILDLVVVFHSGFKGSSLPLTYTVLVMSFLKTLLFIFT